MARTEYQKNYWKQHTVEAAEYHKKWKEQHPEYYKEYKLSPEQKRRKKIYRAQYDIDHAEERHAKWKIYYAKNRDWILENRRKKNEEKKKESV